MQRLGEVGNVLAIFSIFNQIQNQILSLCLLFFALPLVVLTEQIQSYYRAPSCASKLFLEAWFLQPSRTHKKKTQVQKMQTQKMTTFD